MTFDREPDLDNANVGMPCIVLNIHGSHLRNQVASFFYVKMRLVADNLLVLLKESFLQLDGVILRIVSVTSRSGGHNGI